MAGPYLETRTGSSVDDFMKLNGRGIRASRVIYFKRLKDETHTEKKNTRLENAGKHGIYWPPYKMGKPPQGRGVDRPIFRWATRNAANSGRAV